MKDAQPHGLATEVALGRAGYDVVSRFTVPGDTVLGVGLESTRLPEVALDAGRRLEMYVADTSDNMRRQLRDRVRESFSRAFNTGMFQVF